MTQDTLRELVLAVMYERHPIHMTTQEIHAAIEALLREHYGDASAALEAVNAKNRSRIAAKN